MWLLFMVILLPLSLQRWHVFICRFRLDMFRQGCGYTGGEGIYALGAVIIQNWVIDL